MAPAATILCIFLRPPGNVERRKLDGIRRLAKAKDWIVRPIVCGTPERASATVSEAVLQFSPVGCIVDLSSWHHPVSRSGFGRVPVVWLDPSGASPDFGAGTVACDDDAVAAAAFHELSLAVPPCYAVVPFYLSGRQWSELRVKAFRKRCAHAGKDCSVFGFRRASDWGGAARIAPIRAAALAEWAAALPNRCAVFAVNDLTARQTAAAFAAVHRPLPYTATLVGADAAEAVASNGETSGISSVEIDFELAGYLAAKTLAEEIDARQTARKGHGGGNAAFPPLLVVRRKSTRGCGRREPHILEAVEIIRREACDGLTAAGLARRMPGSRKLLELRFREAVGHSVGEEILSVRMERVFTLLRRRDFPISDIAGFCGFRTGIALRELFRSRVKTSMREWRSRHAR